jgi:protein-disulfide isomerase
MTQSRPNGRPSPAGKSAPPTSRRSARQQRLANREANRALARAGTSGTSGGGLGGIMLWTAIAIVIGVVVIGGAFVLTSKPGAVALGSPIAPHVATPTGIPENGRTLGSADAKVTIDAYEDFRCTACYDFTMTTEPQLVDNYLKTGKARLVYHDFLVIDAKQPGSTESRDAANAGLCANDQGKFWALYDWLFTNQSPREAPGAFTLDRLVEIGKDAGLDPTTFEPCVRNGTHLTEVQSEQTAVPSDAGGTPAIYVNGKLTVDASGVSDASYATISAAIDAVLNPASPSPSASASASAAPSATGAATSTVAPTASPS